MRVETCIVRKGLLTWQRTFPLVHLMLPVMLALKMPLLRRLSELQDQSDESAEQSSNPCDAAATVCLH